MKSQTLYLIRGIPGSGKTTKANEMIAENPNLKNFEADQFFVKGGEYKFNPKFLKAAHEWCQDQTRNALKDGHSVIVSNTFTRLWEMDVYVAMTNELGINLEVIEMNGRFQNVHGVPDETVEKMKERYELWIAN